MEDLFEQLVIVFGRDIGRRFGRKTLERMVCDVWRGPDGRLHGYASANTSAPVEVVKAGGTQKYWHLWHGRIERQARGEYEPDKTVFDYT